MTDKVSAGQKASSSPLRRAEFINATIDAVDAHKRSVLGRPVDVIRGQRQTDLVNVKNGTGEDLLPGNVVQLGAYAFDEFDRRNIWFEADTPTDETKFAILAQPVKSGKRGWAHVSGACIALVDISDTDHTRATPVDSETVMESDDTGPVLFLSEITETGEQEVVVLIDYGPGVPIYSFTLTEDMGATTTKQASANISKIDGNSTSSHESDKTVYDPWNVFDGMESGATGPCIKQGGKYYAFNGTCPAE